MQTITIETINDGNIEPCRLLCDELMAFQKSKARLYPQAFDTMTFETRMKKSYENALEKHVAVVRDNEIPVGYVFSTINIVQEKERGYMPDWAPKNGNVTGFYPDWVELPQKIGCLSNLYLRDGYKGMGFGSTLTNMAMDWFSSFEDCKLVFVYISNGNDAALDFYTKKGFTYSHEVFGGFIVSCVFRLPVTGMDKQ